MIETIDLRINKYQSRGVVLKGLILESKSIGEEKSLKLDLMCVEARIDELQTLKRMFEPTTA